MNPAILAAPHRHRLSIQYATRVQRNRSGKKKGSSFQILVSAHRKTRVVLNRSDRTPIKLNIALPFPLDP